MSMAIDHNEVEATLRHSGSSWGAAQAHGLLSSRLALLGAAGCNDWIQLVLENAQSSGEANRESLSFLEAISTETYRQLSGRQSEFVPLLPDDTEPASVMTAALAEWCEGFLHGLVSNVQEETLKARLAREPLSDIIKDMLEMTRAEADDDDDEEENAQAITELVEYLRVAAQLVFEELADLRHSDDEPASNPESNTVH